MRVGRRPLFFGALALICLLMLVPTPREFRWVNVSMAALALFWALALLLEERSFRRLSRGGGRPPPTPPAI